MTECVICHWQRHSNRDTIVTRKARGGADTTWQSAKEVVETLKVDGVSGDETESEDSFGRKIRRRLRRPWLSNQISSLMEVIDSYSMEARDLVGMRKKGNVGSIRLTAATNNDERTYLVNLPVNFYDVDWFRSLDEYEKAELNAQPAKHIPTIVCHVLTFSCCLIHRSIGSLCSRGKVVLSCCNRSKNTATLRNCS